jgi:hypothetical protein
MCELEKPGKWRNRLFEKHGSEDSMVVHRASSFKIVWCYRTESTTRSVVRDATQNHVLPVTTYIEVQSIEGRDHEILIKWSAVPPVSRLSRRCIPNPQVNLSCRCEKFTWTVPELLGTLILHLGF